MVVRATDDQMGKLQPQVPHEPPQHKRAKKPPECFEYIVIHELVHLLEPTHNTRPETKLNRPSPFLLAVAALTLTSARQGGVATFREFHHDEDDLSSSPPLAGCRHAPLRLGSVARCRLSSPKL